jgi:hypothetical protein
MDKRVTPQTKQKRKESALDREKEIGLGKKTKQKKKHINK